MRSKRFEIKMDVFIPIHDLVCGTSQPMTTTEVRELLMNSLCLARETLAAGTPYNMTNVVKYNQITALVNSIASFANSTVKEVQDG